MRSVHKCFLIDVTDFLIDFNDVFRINDEEITVTVYNSQTRSERIFKLKVIDRVTKKYSLQSLNSFGNKLLLHEPKESTFWIEV